MTQTLHNAQTNKTGATPVIVGMSGGVDSSVAAYLLAKAGYEVHGVTMMLWGDADSKDAQAVADRLGIAFSVMDCRSDFIEHVVDPFIEDYENGRTPNPCVCCNRHLKFGRMLKEMLKEFDEPAASDVKIATGHYAEIEHCPDRIKLKKSENLAKDQSYFLYTLDQDVLRRIVFPLAGMDKEDVRVVAEEQGLVTARKKDSQDICFVPDGDHYGFIKAFTGKDYPAGNFVDMEGNVLGQHKGLIRYTVGQRKGLGLSLKKPMYVHHLDTYRNRVVLSDNEELFSNHLIATDFNWVSIKNPVEVAMADPGICYECDDFDEKSLSFRALGRIRYRHKEAPCTVTPNKDGSVSVVFDEPQRAITPGQSLVLYDIETDTYVLGGGIIV